MFLTSLSHTSKSMVNKYETKSYSLVNWILKQYAAQKESVMGEGNTMVAAKRHTRKKVAGEV